MARKKKPKIAGSDPSYTSDFSEFNKLPTNKPAEVAEPEPKPVVKAEPKPDAVKVAPAAQTRKPRAKPAAAAPSSETCLLLNQERISDQSAI